MLYNTFSKYCYMFNFPSNFCEHNHIQIMVQATCRPFDFIGSFRMLVAKQAVMICTQILQMCSVIDYISFPGNPFRTSNISLDHEY
jgi:hypothetical protein